MKDEKSVEELQKQQEEAAKQLKMLLDQTRPKGLKQGVTQGIGSIVQGAVGAAGVAVIGPTLGLAVGLKQGGILGGILGALVGVVGGALGAAALAVGGALTGVVQIGRGIIATPESILAPRLGKWWNEFEGKWVLTKLPEEEEKILKGVPDDDRDILGKVQDEIDGSKTPDRAPSEVMEVLEVNIDGEIQDTIVKQSGATVEVADMYYYDMLEVPATAPHTSIKRKYYLLARKYHPDKVGADNQEAAEIFKAISESYQVLSNPELRAKYDKEGRAGLSPDKTSAANPTIDPALLYAFLFGSDMFNDYIGRLATATSASVGDSQQISLQDARTLQKRRVTRLALKLVEKITPWIWIDGELTGDGYTVLKGPIEEAWKLEAIRLSEASYGYQLVTTIGQIYNMVGTMFEGSIDSGIGLPSLSSWAERQKARLESKKALQDNSLEHLKAGLDMVSLAAQTEQKLAEAKTEEEKIEITKQLDRDVANILLRILWTTLVVDITSTIHEATKMVFFDQSVDSKTRKYRGQAVKRLGELWMNVPKPQHKAEDLADVYEAAAFAAMVETIHRRDEATSS